MDARSPETRAARSRRTLQIAVGLCSLVPITAGGAGMLLGPALVASTGTPDLDSHFRYLSGLLLGIGVAYLLTLRNIERRRRHYLLLGGLVVVGGIGRLISLLATGTPSPVMLLALAMELLVTPVLTLWQFRISAPLHP
jgi:hypothetical protein